MSPYRSISSQYADSSFGRRANGNSLETTATEINSNRSMSLRHLLHMVLKRKRMVLTVFFVCASVWVALLFLLFSKPLYLATSQLLISPAREEVSENRSGGSVPPWFGFNTVEQTAWTVEMLKGRYLAERVVQKVGPAVLYPSLQQETTGMLGVVAAVSQNKMSHENDQLLHEEAVEAFLKNVDAKPAGRSSIVQLSFRHENPELAARVVNLLSEMYLERHLGVQRNAERDAFFQEQSVALKDKLADSQEKIRILKQRHGITGSVEEERKIAIEQLVRLRKDVDATRSEEPHVQSRAAELRRQLARTTRAPSKIEQMRETLTRLEIQENEHALRMTEQNPTLISLRMEIKTLRQKLNDMGAEEMYGTSTRESLHANLEAGVLRDEAEAKALRAREQAQSIKLAEYQRRLDALERIQPEFQRLLSQLHMDENNDRLYLTKFEESRIARAMDAQKITSVRVIEEAQPPKTPMDSQRNRKMLLGIVASAVAAVALAMWMHFLDDSFDSADDVERVLDLPVLAAIPEMKGTAITPDLLKPSDRRAGIPASTDVEVRGLA